MKMYRPEINDIDRGGGLESVQIVTNKVSITIHTRDICYDEKDTSTSA